MFNRNDLTISMFYASSTNDDGSKTAAITVQVNGPAATAVQTSQLLCVTDKAKVKTYVVGEQSIKDGSDPLLVAIENYWRQNTQAVVGQLMNDVLEFIAGNVSQGTTWLGFNGLKVFENDPLENRIPEAVLDADGGSVGSADDQSV
ncbi:hypothetical protein LG71_19570 [Pluralibacter gergoviae]|uniref:hypothetical protein n=1 Tax=Pluralibacter gergoviae TaxID=61647 RepID=UPI0004F7D370|nr:hypothetical protein [Pluralibacter gergoviae]AIR01958.1 hypothetical protein LG71_19570 [Pluralibacter gergoviae]